MAKIIKLISFFCLLLAVLINFDWLKIPALSIILGLVYFLIFGYLLGKNIFKSQEVSFQTILGIFSLISLYSLLGAVIYYLYQLDTLAINVLLVIISGCILYPEIVTESKMPEIKWPKTNPASIILTITYLIITAASFIVLWHSQTTEAIFTPWQVIPREFFALYVLATVNLLLIIFRNKNFLTPFLIVMHYFLTISVALIIYKLGYGFDPFIHQATEKVIFDKGLILPKPFYYLGQYSLVVFLAKFLQQSVDLIDKLLLPILLSVFLPYTIYKSLKKTFDWQKSITLILGLSFLLLPFGLFIATTPQALAGFYCLVIIFLSFLYFQNKQIPLAALILLALTTIAIHPIAGLPILIYLIILYLVKNLNNLAVKIILPIFCALSAFILPIALLFNSFISINKVSWLPNSVSFIDWPSIFMTQFRFFPDLAYLYRNFIYWLFILIALITFAYLIKTKRAKIFVASLITFAILVINAFLLNFIKVNYIINYEQGDFSRRVWQIAFYFLLPIVCYGLYFFIQKAWQKSAVYKIFLIVSLTLSLTLCLYLSYPRFDDYDNSKFINVSAADFQAVQFIDKDSAGQNYIVLVNQMTSAAALQTFGFTNYYNNNYFYPIPTGGDLYKYYEKMIYTETSKKTMVAAMDFAKVKLAYFVLPTYLKTFTQIDQKAESSADMVYNIGDKIYIYKYSK
ncbi:MAG: hypothetical protein PHC97_02575 [Patescibacteria group bacterium]|nr:hypothetical protein [Patescibacteria group bacterium]